MANKLEQVTKHVTTREIVTIRMPEGAPVPMGRVVALFGRIAAGERVVSVAVEFVRTEFDFSAVPPVPVRRRRHA